MTYEDEQREQHQRVLDQNVDDRVYDAIAYTERENANLLSEVTRLQRRVADLENMLRNTTEDKGYECDECGLEAVYYNQGTQELWCVKCHGRYS